MGGNANRLREPVKKFSGGWDYRVTPAFFARKTRAMSGFLLVIVDLGSEGDAARDRRHDLRLILVGDEIALDQEPVHHVQVLHRQRTVQDQPLRVMRFPGSVQRACGRRVVARVEGKAPLEIAKSATRGAVGQAQDARRERSEMDAPSGNVAAQRPMPAARDWSCAGTWNPLRCYLPSIPPGSARSRPSSAW